MQGIILCGGQSLRMGKDKGLLNVEDTTWAQSSLDKLSGLDIAVSLSINSLQYQNYSQLFPANILIEDNQLLQIYGPLAGVLSAHLKYPKEDLFVLACDITQMNTSILKILYNAYNSILNKDAYIFINDEKPEPLCGIYCSKGLAKILQMKEAKTLVRHSMKFVLSQLNVYYITLRPEEKVFFKNFNTPSDI